jgi:hypothetical protein
MMQFLKYLALVSLTALIFPAAMLARNSNEHNVDLTDSVEVGHTPLKAGTYKVEWNGAGPNVQVAFLEHGKQVATAPATLKTNDKQITQDDYLIRTTATNVKALREIDFGHQKEALVFSTAGL